MKKGINLGLLIACFLLYGLLFYGVPRTQFLVLSSVITLLFIGYFFIVKSAIDFRWSIAFRLIPLLAFPALSDDFYRFVFDGRLVATGLNPYLILPEKFFQSADYQSIIADSFIYENLNSKQYFTVYPPFNQFLFGLAAWFSGKNLWLNIIFLRLIIFFFEAATVFLLHHQFGKKIARWYAFNPFIIIELSGNLHFEAVMIFFLLASLWLLKEDLIPLAAVCFGLAVSTKLLPLIFLPVIIAEKRLAKGISFAIMSGCFNLMLASFFYDSAIVQNFASSLNLYFQKFEFNASFYYLVRAWGYATHGYNIIGKSGVWLGISAVVGIGIIACLRLLLPKKISFEESLLFTLFWYLLMATTVHPWYIATLLALGLLTRFKFVVLWSGLVFLSYHAYQTTIFSEQPIIVTAEYLLLGSYLIYEIFWQKKELI